MNPLLNEHVEQHSVIPIDVFSKLANGRTLFISEEIDDKLAVDISATLMLKELEDENDKITIFINSDGGDIRDVLMIYDTMKMMQCPVETVCIGAAMDAAVLLLAGGTVGWRFATANSVICPSQLVPDTYSYSDLTGAKSAMDRIQKDNKDLMTALADCTGKKSSELMKEFERKKFLTPKQAVKYGFIDEVLSVK